MTQLVTVLASEWFEQLSIHLESDPMADILPLKNNVTNLKPLADISLNSRPIIKSNPDALTGDFYLSYVSLHLCWINLYGASWISSTVLMLDGNALNTMRANDYRFSLVFSGPFTIHFRIGEMDSCVSFKVFVTLIAFLRWWQLIEIHLICSIFQMNLFVGWAAFKYFE